MNKFTPGPWTHEKTMAGNLVIHDSKGDVIMGIRGAALHRDHPEANAALIAAAPDMFYELNSIRSIIDLGPDAENEPWAADMIDRIDAILEKALGVSSETA